MKEGWKCKQLLDVCDFQGGSQPPKAEWAKEELPGFVRMLQIRDYTQSRNVAPEYVKITNRIKTCQADDIMIGRYGASLGKILTGLSGAYNVALMKTIPDLKVITKPYLRLYLLSNIFQNFLLKIGGRAAQAGFSKEDLKGLEIPVPPLSEQAAIVSYLDSAFAKIDALKTNAEKELEEAKSLFQSAVKEMMTPKEGWDVKSLEQVCNFSSGFAFKSSKFTETGAPIIRISDIQNNRIETSHLVYFNPDSYKENLNKYLVFPNDILIAMSGGTTGKLGINKTGCKFYLNQRVGVFREDKNVLNHLFLYYFLQTKTEESLKIAAGAAQPNLSTAQINAFRIPIPPLTIQQEIVDYLDSLSDKIITLETNYTQILSECSSLKQAILKQIFE